jgi:hypothetical protein
MGVECRRYDARSGLGELAGLPLTAGARPSNADGGPAPAHGQRPGTQQSTHASCPNFEYIGSICVHCAEPDDDEPRDDEPAKRPVVLDSDVLLGLADPTDSAHQLATTFVPAYSAAGHPLVVPATVYAQALTSPLCSTPLGLMRLRITVARHVAQVQALDVVAARIAAKHRNRHPELPMKTAYTFAAAEVLHAECILTTEDRWAHLSGLVRVLDYGYTVPPASDTTPAPQHAPGQTPQHEPSQNDEPTDTAR